MTEGWGRIRTFAVGALAIVLLGVLVAVGFVAMLVLVPVAVVLFLLLRWYVMRHATVVRREETIVEGVAVDVTDETDGEGPTRIGRGDGRPGEGA